MALDVLRQLGMTDEQIQDRLIAKIASDFLRETHSDVFCDDEDFDPGEDFEDLDESEREAKLKEIEALRKDASMMKLLGTHLRKHFVKEFSGAVEKMSTEVVEPILRQMITEKVFKKTNSWGERISGETLTVMEFLEKQCKEYLLQDVNEKGKAKDECGDYDSRNWKNAGKRIDVMVESEVSSRISEAVQLASQASLKAVGAAYRDRINSAVTMALDSVRIDVRK